MKTTLKKLKLIGVFTGMILFILSCFKDEYDFNTLSKQIEFRPEINLPIGSGSLAITDFVEPDDSVIFFDGDSIKIYFTQDSLFSFVMEDFFNIPDQERQIERFELGKTEVEADTFERIYTLDELSDRSSEPTRTNIRSKFGTNDIFPIIPVQDLGDFEVDTLKDFSYIEIDSGKIYMSVQNNLPVVVSSMTLTIRNVDDNTVVSQNTFIDIQPGETQLKESDLEDVILTNKLYAQVTQIGSPGSSPNIVPIDTADDVTTLVYTSKLKVRRGNAVLPYQIFEEKYTKIPVQMDKEGTTLSLVELETGQIDYTLASYIKDDIIYEIILPNTIKDGEVVQKEIELIKLGQTSGVLDLAGTTTTLEDDSIPVIYRITLDPSGQRVDFDFTDDINYQSTLSFYNIGILTAEGNFGSDTIEIERSSFQLPLEGFDYFRGTFDLTNPTINFVYTNSYGIPMNFKLNMTGVYGTGTNTTLNAPGMDLDIPDNRDSDPINSSLVYDKTTVPNIVNFLRFPPSDSIVYTGVAYTNPLGENTNFIRKTSNLNIGLELELPLELRAENIAIQDTIPFNLSGSSADSTNTAEETDVDEGADLEFGETTLHYRIVNGFPFDMDFNLVAYDSITNTKYDTIEVDFLKAAKVGPNGIVDSTTINTVEDALLLDEDFINALNDEANSIILVGNLNTTKDDSGIPKSVKVLTTYAIKFNIGISTNVSIRPK